MSVCICGCTSFETAQTEVSTFLSVVRQVVNQCNGCQRLFLANPPPELEPDPPCQAIRNERTNVGRRKFDPENLDNLN